MSLLTAALLTTVVVVYFQQWLFALLVVAFIVFALRLGRRFDREAFERDIFKSGRVRVEVLAEVITFHAGTSSVALPYSELSHLLEYPRGFLLLHHSGIQLRVPRSALTESELAILVNLQRALPKIAMRMYAT